MRNPMTDDELTAIKARAEAATPGPWMSFNTDDALEMNVYGVTTSGDLWADEPEAKNGHGDIIALTLFQSPRIVDHASRRWDANAEFIAGAREDIPALLAEVERLKSELARIREASDELLEGIDVAMMEFKRDSE